MTIIWAEEHDQGDPKEQTTRYNQDHSWQREITEFANVIVNQAEIQHGTIDDAIKTMELVYQVYCADPAWQQRWSLSDQFPILTATSKQETIILNE